MKTQIIRKEFQKARNLIFPIKFLAKLLSLGYVFAFYLYVSLNLSLAQAPGTTYINNANITITVATDILDESCYFGPNSVVEVNADLVIYSKNVWIAPSATFTGSGKIIFRNPSIVGGAASATFIDGNDGAFIPVNIDHDNLEDIILSNLETQVSANPLTSFSMPDPASTSTGDLKIGAQFNMISNNQTGSTPPPFNGGELVLNGNNFNFNETGTIHGFRNQRFVDTGNSIEGHMIKTFGAAPNNEFVFPVGFKPTSYEYTPARITSTSGTFYVSTQDFAESASNEDVLAAEENVSRTWHIYADSPIVAKVETQHQSGLEDNGWDSSLPYIVARWLGGITWEQNAEAQGSSGNLSDLVVGANNNNIQSNFEPTTLRELTYEVPSSPSSTLSYSTHSYRSNSALPLTVISFNAVEEGTSSKLSWRTSSEVNTKSFEIQRSIEGKKWITIGSVAANGQSTELVNYNFTDNMPEAGINYYRLKMIDINGAFAFSQIEQTLVKNDNIFTIYPNPSSDYISIDMRDWNKVSRIFIINSTGQEIYKSEKTTNNQLSIKHLPKGIYLLKIVNSDGKINSKRFMVNN